MSSTSRSWRIATTKQVCTAFKLLRTRASPEVGAAYLVCKLRSAGARLLNHGAGQRGDGEFEVGQLGRRAIVERRLAEDEVDNVDHCGPHPTVWQWIATVLAMPHECDETQGDYAPLLSKSTT